SEMEVSQPRMPCYKLAVKFGRDDILKRFLASGRTGFYLRVLAEGQLATGAVIAPIKRASASVPVAEIARLYRDGTDNADVLRRVAAIEALADGWRDYFRGRLEKLRS
ncbi:MAG TPA: 3-alpha domain-containing protein, partial [Blastocatellia bacterium]|nr:3-alpha domain-containing protein [Blastocatellia bacterium]